jgi:hypothetical protein
MTLRANNVIILLTSDNFYKNEITVLQVRCIDVKSEIFQGGLGEKFTVQVRRVRIYGYVQVKIDQYKWILCG